MSNVKESIFDNGSVIIPMAEVNHIEYQKSSVTGNNGILIILKGTRWDMQADTWSNPCYIPEDKKQTFIKAWCQYRAEVEELI